MKQSLSVRPFLMPTGMYRTLVIVPMLLFFLWPLTHPTYARSLPRRISFDKGWTFYRGSAPEAVRPDYDDTAWRKLDLPHDWSVEPSDNPSDPHAIGPFSRSSTGGSATGQTVGGEGWYRKTFTIPAKRSGMRHLLYFEGVYAQSEVYINGRLATTNVYGYSSFRCDITDFCLPAGQPNVVTVHVCNEGKNTRWYAGSGIYRHVWLISTPDIRLDDWETAVRTVSVGNNRAHIEVETHILSAPTKGTATRLEVELLSPAGKRTDKQSVPLPSPLQTLTPVSCSLTVNAPQLWSPETPVRYTARLTLWNDKQQLDRIDIPFGIRTLEFSADRGFLLNGKMVKLKGGCVHHDNGLLGAASFDRAEERKVELLKQNGYNAVRCSHNPPAVHFLDACDSLGLLVIDEAFDQWRKPKNPQDYHRFFDEWSDRDIQTMVRRDRNHPSIIMWSIGNEIQERADTAGMEIATRLKADIHALDRTRPVTAAINAFWDNWHYKWEKDVERAFRHLDVGGYNYMWKEYEKDHKAHPDRIIYGSESVAKEASQNWDLVEKHPYVIGDFVWTALDYLGEAGIAHALELKPGERDPQFMDWPWNNGWCGDVDLCGTKKPQSYYRDVVWRRRDISMAVEAPVPPGKTTKISYWGWQNEQIDWTFPEDMQGQLMHVNTYTHAPAVRLYLNGRIIGEHPTSDTYWAGFEVPYQPGILRAVELYGDKEGASFSLQTTGAPAGIRLTADRKQIGSGGNDIVYITAELTDADGRVIRDNSRHVRFTCEGAGTLIASGNAAPDDMESFHSPAPRLFNGRAMAIIRSADRKGRITVKVSSPGLPETDITVKVR